MKTMLNGDEAAARGAWEAGVHVATAYPGTPSTEILEAMGKYKEVHAQWSINEKVAVEVAGGAAIGGARALVCMKHVGLNVAADPFFTLAYTGVTGGLVIVTADDPGMHSSQNEQDNRHYARAAKVPCVEPSDAQETKEYMQQSFALSEQFDTPVLFRLTTRLCHTMGVVELGERVAVPVKPYVKDPAKTVMLPSNARGRHVVVEKRMRELERFVETSPLNRVEMRDPAVGFITNGVSYQYVREIFPNASILRYGFTWPIALGLARDFRQRVAKLYVVEEGDGFLEEALKAAGIALDGGKDRIPLTGELDADLVRKAFASETVQPTLTGAVQAPPRPPALCPGCGHRGVLWALQREKAAIFGDIGCYTLGALPPLSAMDTCIDMGASISAAIGMALARRVAGEPVKLASVIGDSTFMHSGMTGLVDAVHNKVPFVAVILDNGITAMTGHQNNPVTGKTLREEDTHHVDLKAVALAAGVKPENIHTIEGNKLLAARELFQKLWDKPELSVVLAKCNCTVAHRFKDGEYWIDEEKCVGCKMCIKIGCPALSFKDEERKAAIDATLCVGCGMCVQMCKVDAIVRPAQAQK